MFYQENVALGSIWDTIEPSGWINYCTNTAVMHTGINLLIWNSSECLHTYTCPVKECKPRVFISSCWYKSALELCQCQRRNPQAANRLADGFSLCVLRGFKPLHSAVSFYCVLQAYISVIYSYWPVNFHSIYLHLLHETSSPLLCEYPSIYPSILFCWFNVRLRGSWNLSQLPLSERQDTPCTGHQSEHPSFKKTKLNLNKSHVICCICDN